MGVSTIEFSKDWNCRLPPTQAPALRTCRTTYARLGCALLLTGRARERARLETQGLERHPGRHSPGLVVTDLPRVQSGSDQLDPETLLVALTRVGLERHSDLLTLRRPLPGLHESLGEHRHHVLRRAITVQHRARPVLPLLDHRRLDNR